MTPARFNVPPAWTNQRLVLYHGTTNVHESAIKQTGIDLNKCRSHTDFGQGFYTTTVLSQAKSWAWDRSQMSGSAGNPVVLRFEVDRMALAKLDILAFVRGGRNANDFWSIIFYCRHGSSAGQYDVVCGPVTAFWMQRLVIQDCDQYSFHTSKAIPVLKHMRTIPVR